MKCKTPTIVKIFIFSALITVCSTAKSQNNEFIVGSMLGFYGIHIEGDIDNIYSPSNGTIWGTGGISFGLNVKRYFSNHIYGALEMRYIRKGNTFEFINPYGLPSFVTIKLDYIEMPLLVGFKINLKKKYLLAETGIVFARMISSKMEVSEFYGWDPAAEMNNFRKNDFSWVANIKYPIIRNEKLLLGFRFSYSLFSIHTTYKLYNMDYGIEIYYLFNRNVK